MVVLKLFLMCLTLHFISDYTLQGILAQMKQKKWWREQTQDVLYANDWVCGLVCHSVYWTLVTFAPVFYLLDLPVAAMVWVFVVNATVHAVVDHWKCNCFMINLCHDQFAHLLQIIGTVALVTI